MRTICGVALMLMIGVLPATAAPAPEGRLLGGFESGIWFLLKQNDSQIRDELKLTESQVKKIEELIAEAGQASANARGPDGKIDKQKSQDLLDLNRRQAETAAKLLTKPQLMRAEQIFLQGMGPAFALRQPQVAAALKLTKEQKETIDLIRMEYSQELRGLAPVGGGRGQERSQKIAELRKSQEEKLLNVLAPAQRAKWSLLLGTPFKPEPRRSEEKAKPSRAPDRPALAK
jgi:Spy/CpxP family protein refolding chaperone